MIPALRGVRRSDAVLALAVLAGIVLVAWLGKPPGDAGRDTFATTDYRSGGYAAWFELMRRENVAVEHFDRRPAELDARIGTLIASTPVVAAGTDARQPPDLAALGHWVDNGGRVVVLGSGTGAVLLTPDGSAVRRPPLDVAGSAGGTLHGPLADGVRRLAGLSAVRFSLRGGRGGPSRVLLADGGGPIVVERRYGRGTVVFVSDARPFDNAFIAQGDNARVAFALAQPPDGAALAFDETLHGELTDRRWWSAIDVPTRVALSGIALAITLALVGSALRLGPPLTMRPAREPASDEFIAAVAALYQRANAHHAAITMLAGGPTSAGAGPSAAELQRLVELRSPMERDVVDAAALAYALREGA